MLAVVTGAYGFLGVNPVRALLARGVQVRAAGIRTTESLGDLDVEHCDIDVLDHDSLRQAFDGADAVFHLAALISIVGDPNGMVRMVNVDGASTPHRLHSTRASHGTCIAVRSTPSTFKPADHRSTNRVPERSVVMCPITTGRSSTANDVSEP